MKRSRINQIVSQSISFMEDHSWSLPEWAYWNESDWKKSRSDCQRIFDCQLGWDITDFGSSDFSKRGLVMFTQRNGGDSNPGKTYAEKIMIVGDSQLTPFHFHWNKMEDIINRGGGKLMFQLHKATSDEQLSDEAFDVYIDDRRYRINGGEYISLNPGQSLCLETHVYHRFFAEDGDVLCGEVSKVNDDNTDNRFYEKVGRFPDIEEDEEIRHFLVNDYKQFQEHGSL